MAQLDALEEGLGVSFRDPDLLRLAMVHSSYLNENPGAFQESNERLEFLGDAVVGLAVAHRLHQLFPQRPEGDLTALRSELVRAETLARAAESLGLGRHLYLGRGEEEGGGRERQSNLAAGFEALVGALFLDQGYDVAADAVMRSLDADLAEVGQSGFPKDPKSLLQEVVQGRGGESPAYRVVHVEGKDHARRYTSEVLVSGEVLGRGTGGRKAVAEQEAAKEALGALEQD